MKKLYKEQGSVRGVSRATGLDRKTVRKYVQGGQEIWQARDYRTRADPFEDDWPQVEVLLAAEPKLEAKTVLLHLMKKRPGHYHEGQLRTLQRRFRKHRALKGPEKEIFFPQAHIAGEALQTDFTEGGELQVTHEGETFAHKLCVCTLPYSNWRFATVTQSESLLGLGRGITEALFELGRVPLFSQTDNSTAAPHALKRTGKKRSFNQRYLDLCSHYGMSPRTTAIGKKEQNGDVEVSNRHLKRLLSQALMLRGHRDFASIEAYEAFVWEVCQSQHYPKLGQELAVMKPLLCERACHTEEMSCQVGKGSTIRLYANTYSVPSRLIGHRITAVVSEFYIDVYFQRRHVMQAPRQVGKFQSIINYRHIIKSLIDKPGAFARYKHKQACFPTLTFRKAYDVLCAGSASDFDADLSYLRLLKLSADEGEQAVDKLLTEQLDAKPSIDIDGIKEHLQKKRRPQLPAQAPIALNLQSYDALLPNAARGITVASSQGLA